MMMMTIDTLEEEEKKLTKINLIFFLVDFFFIFI